MCGPGHILGLHDKFQTISLSVICFTVSFAQNKYSINESMNRIITKQWVVSLAMLQLIRYSIWNCWIVKIKAGLDP